MKTIGKHILIFSGILIASGGYVKADGCNDVSVLDAELSLVRAIGDENQIRQATQIVAEAKHDLVTQWEPLFNGISSDANHKDYFTGSEGQQRKEAFVERFMDICRAQPTMGMKSALYYVIGRLPSSVDKVKDLTE